MKTSLPYDSCDRLWPNRDPELNKWRKTDGWYEVKDHQGKKAVTCRLLSLLIAELNDTNKTFNS